ncbi:putative serine/threonine-protein kinase MPS1 like protein [Dictyocoela muelleri]|nr:putative serine/threonine-protein kinase MPS1 like protein [Dictyocoela muelleri]
MDGIFNSKDLLNFLESQNFTSNTRKLTYYFNAIKKDLSPDIYTLQIYLNYIETLKNFETTDEIRRIYRMMEITYMRYKQYWKEYLNFEITNKGRVKKIVNDAIKSISTKTYKEKDEVLKYLNDIKNNLVNDNSFIHEQYNGNLYFLEDNLKRTDFEQILKNKNKNNNDIFDKSFSEGDNKFNNIKYYEDNSINDKHNNNYYGDNNSKYYEDNFINDKNNNFKNNNFKNDKNNNSINNNSVNINSINDNNDKNNNFKNNNSDKEVKKFSCKMITDEYSLKLTDQIKLLSKENHKNGNNQHIKTKKENSYKDLKYISLKDKELLILRLIGTGGSSKVYQVLFNNKNYALKKVNMNNTNLYINEIRMLEKLKGFDGIIEMIDYEVKSDEILILMEYGDCDLSSIIPRRKRKVEGVSNFNEEYNNKFNNNFNDNISGNFNDNFNSKALSVSFIRSIWEQIIIIMKRVYEEKIVHCDLKPQNFIFVKGKIKLIDFGISKMGLNDTTSVINDNRGTVNYIAPEMVKNEKIKRSVDIWSLGCILYELVYNKSIFEGNMLQKINFLQNNKEIEYEDKAGYERLISVIKMCLKYEPEDRVNINDLIYENYLYQRGIDNNSYEYKDFNSKNENFVDSPGFSKIIPDIVDYVKNNNQLPKEELVRSITNNLDFINKK